MASATSLKLALERIIVQTKFQGADTTAQLASLAKLGSRSKTTSGERAAPWPSSSARRLSRRGTSESGMHWYERAVAAPDGRASMKAAEQLANVRGRLGWDDRRQGAEASRLR